MSVSGELIGKDGSVKKIEVLPSAENIRPAKKGVPRRIHADGTEELVGGGSVDDGVIVIRRDASGKVIQSGPGMQGEALIQVFDEDGNLKDERKATNLITTAGDEYYAKRGAAAVVPAAPADVTKMTGMKLGTGTTAAAKSGAGAALVTYETGSNNPFDATYPQFVDLTGDTGWQIVYRTSWAAGDVTETALTEAVIVNDAATDATTTAANTISRVVFTAINKTASDTLVITWNHTFNAA